MLVSTQTVWCALVRLTAFKDFNDFAVTVGEGCTIPVQIQNRSMISRAPRPTVQHAYVAKSKVC